MIYKASKIYHNIYIIDMIIYHISYFFTLLWSNIAMDSAMAPGESSRPKNQTPEQLQAGWDVVVIENNEGRKHDE